MMYFSPSGCLFACKTCIHGIHLWKDSPAGYVFHRELPPNIGGFADTRLSGAIGPFLSPNGESIIASKNGMTQLWHITDPTIPYSSIPTQPTLADFLLEFSPDGSLATFAKLGGNIATVLDLELGNPRLIIDTGMRICGLRVAGDTVVVVDEERIITWNLPAGGHVLNTEATINDSVRTIMLNHPTPAYGRLLATQISSDFNYAVIMRSGGGGLGIYDMAAGNHLTGITTDVGDIPWITRDGCEVWDAYGYPDKGWKIIKDGKSRIVGLERLPENALPSEGYPWTSSHGHDVTKDGWIFNSRKERLLWLPHRWRKDKWSWKWDGRFFGLLDNELPEPVIIELRE